jgi:hypothetical protein
VAEEEEDQVVVLQVEVALDVALLVAEVAQVEDPLAAEAVDVGRSNIYCTF